MDKIRDMQPKQMADDELEQINGGRKLWDVFTAEFRDFFGKPTAQKLPMEEADKNGLLHASTLDMRVTDYQKEEPSKKTMKL